MPRKAKPEAKAVKPAKNTVKKPESTGENQVSGQAATQFKPGQSGNPAGRPAGSRNKFCKAMLNDFAEVWREANENGITTGKAALADLAKDKPGEFVRAALQWVPQEFELGENTNSAFRQIWEALANNKIPKPQAAESGDDD